MNPSNLRDRRIELRMSEHDLRELRKLRAYLGQAARLDCMPRHFTFAAAVRTAVVTMVNEFERNGFPDHPRRGAPRRKGGGA